MDGQSDRVRGITRPTTGVFGAFIGITACLVLVSAAMAAGTTAGAAQVQYEPANDEIGTAPTIEPGSYTGLENPSRDDDYYAVEVDERDRLVVNISFDESAGDLDLVVYDDGLSDRIDESRSIDGGTERVVVDAPEDDTFYVLVTGYRETVTYDMSVSLDQLPPRDQFEPNDDPAAGARIQPGTYLDLGIIDGEKDVYEFDAAAGDEIAARTTAERANGDLDLTIYAPNGTAIGEGNSLAATDETVNATADAAGTYRLIVWGMAGVTTTYELELAVGPDAANQVGSDGTGSGSSSAGTAGGSGNGSGGGSGGSNGSPGFGVPAALGGLVLALFVARGRQRE